MNIYCPIADAVRSCRQVILALHLYKRHYARSKLSSSTFRSLDPSVSLTLRPSPCITNKLVVEAPVPCTARLNICKASSRTFSTQSPLQKTSTATQRRKYRDPYATAQAKARKAANITRQEILKKQREEALGDPIRGVTTDFVRSFDNGQDASDSQATLRYLIKSDELDAQIVRSRILTKPNIAIEMSMQGEMGNPIRPEQRDQFERHVVGEFVEKDASATEAIRRILHLKQGSSKDRLHSNIQRCINTFGRHNTDTQLPGRPSAAPTDSALAAIQSTDPDSTSKQRAGPDTGSSEVQIAILTAKIRSLADFVSGRGRKDRINKRNLRLLVHKRQKLLQYLKRRERGGPRWQHCIETLGLTEGTWKGEITV